MIVDKKLIKQYNSNLEVLRIGKAQRWQEIKSLEQEYKRNQSAIKELQDRQSDISFDIQKKLDWMNRQSEILDEFAYKNKLGEFSN